MIPHDDVALKYASRAAPADIFFVLGSEANESFGKDKMPNKS